MKGLVRSHCSGWSDVTLGTKVSLLQQHHLYPAVSLLSGVSMPTGARQIGSGSYNPSLGFALSESLPAKFSLSATYTFQSKLDGDSRSVDRTTAISAGHSIRKGLTGYVELYFDESGSSSGGQLWLDDYGVSQTIHGQVQIDVEAGSQFAGAGKLSFIAAGLVYRSNLGLRGVATRLFAH